MPKQNPPPSFGDRLRSLREQEGWSLREVALRAGVNHGYLSQLERNEVAQPAPAMLHKLATGYGESFVTLMRWAGYVEEDTTEVSGITPNQARALSYLGDDVSDEELLAVRAVLDAIRRNRATMVDSATSLDAPMSDAEQRRIRATMTDLLRRADAFGVVPTPLDAVLGVAKLVSAGEVTLSARERRDLRKVFGDLVDRVLDRLQGAVHFRAREVWVQPGLHALRKRFVTAHEIGHATLPWQHDIYAYLDDSERLSPAARVLFEREANQAAIELLAQGDRLRREADDSPISVELLSSLSARFQLSLQATARRVVEETRQEAALAIRFRGGSGNVGPFHLYQSARFYRSFDWGCRVPCEALASARAASRIGAEEFVASTTDERARAVMVEVVNTPRAQLVIFAAESPVRRGLHRLRRAG